jgi:hypothetical protein
MIGRALAVLRTVLIVLSQLVQVMITGAAHIAGLAAKPRARDTLSAVIGRASLAGRRWPRWPERIIDWIFERLGDAPGHCRREAMESMT